MLFQTVKIKKKELHHIEMCVSLTLPAPNPCEPRPLAKRDPLSAKLLEISTKTNLGLLMRNSLKICPIKTLLIKKLLCLLKASNLFQPPKNRLHKKNLIRDFNSFARSMRLKYMFVDAKSNLHPFYVRSNWQPPPQSSVALEHYLEQTKLVIAH